MKDFLTKSGRFAEGKETGISIFSSCVGRDIFRLAPDECGYVVEQFINRISPISMMSPPNQLDADYLEAAVDKLSCRNFIKRMIYFDLVNCCWDYFRERTSDFFLIDMANIRFNLNYDKNGCCYTIPPTQKNLDKQLQDTGIYKNTKTVSPEDITEEEIREAVRNFALHVLAQYKQHQIILLDVCPADEYYDSQHNIKSFSPIAAKWNIYVCNYAIPIAFNYLRELMPQAHVIPFPKGAMGDENHEWGLHIFHFVKEYYSYALAAVDLITKHDPESVQKIEILKLQTEENMLRKKVMALQIEIKNAKAAVIKPNSMLEKFSIEPLIAPFWNDIGSNTDLNMVNAPGTYRCVSGEIKKTVQNCPPTFKKNVGFRLTVKQIAVHTKEKAPLIQILEPNLPTAPVYRRYYSAVKTQWSPWYRLVTDTDLAKLWDEAADLRSHLQSQEKTIQEILNKLKDK